MYSLFYRQKSECLLKMPVSFFILNNHVTGNFSWRDFWIIFTTGKLLGLDLTVFFLPKRVILFTLLPLLILSLLTIKVTRLVYHLYQCFMTGHRVDEKDILS